VEGEEGVDEERGSGVTGVSAEAGSLLRRPVVGDEIESSSSRVFSIVSEFASLRSRSVVSLRGSGHVAPIGMQSRAIGECDHR
jgi:hypothetical protein